MNIKRYLNYLYSRSFTLLTVFAVVFNTSLLSQEISQSDSLIKKNEDIGFSQFWIVFLIVLFILLVVGLLIKVSFQKVVSEKNKLKKKYQKLVKQNEIQKREIEIQKNIAHFQKEKIEDQVKKIKSFEKNFENKVKEKTRALEIAKEKAEKSDRLKSSFLSNMSHEIRTPMNAIIGFSDLLLDDTFSEQDRRDFAELIRTNGDHLLKLLSDIIDISMIEADRLTLSFSGVDINKLLSDVYSSSMGNQTYREKKECIDLVCEESEENITINTDSVRVTQILLNLINNALKFTEQGEIRFGFKIIHGFVEFFVSDNGVGIDEELKKNVFNRFILTDQDKQNPLSGKGLGLAICKTLVEKLGGRIWVESEKNEGATFYFTIPLS